MSLSPFPSRIARHHRSDVFIRAEANGRDVRVLVIEPDGTRYEYVVAPQGVGRVGLYEGGPRG